MALARDLLLAGPSTSKMPKLIYGTAWKGDRTDDLVYRALRAGFRAIDTAAQPKHYDEHAVGSGVRRAVLEGLVQRDDLFIQTKFTALAGQGDDTPYRRDAPLADMDTVTAWQTLESFTPRNIRYLGMSNSALDMVQTLHESMIVKPAVVQNRFVNCTNFDTVLRRFCRNKGIVYQCFWTITANATLSKSPPVRQVAKKAGVSIVAAYYALILGLEHLAVLDGTTDEAHMKDDINGIHQVSQWAEGTGAVDWEASLTEFKCIIGET